MPQFKWSGKDSSGVSKSGVIEAANQSAAMGLLRQQKITPDSVAVKKGFNMDMEIPGMDAKPTPKDLVIFTRQFATMIDAGLPLVQCLDILASQQEKKTFKRILMKVKGDVEGGATFADALGKHPRLFDSLYVNLVAAGEVGGILDTILNRLAAYIEKAEALKSKVKSAMVYPAVILGVAVIVTTILMIFVVPMFEEMFSSASSEAPLPLPTQILVAVSRGLQKYFLLIIGVAVVSVVAFTYFRRTDLGNVVIDNVLLKVPVFGPLIKKVAVARFTRTLGTMITSGVPILDALEITAKTAGNVVVEKDVMHTRTGISEGKTIAEPLSDSKVFPPMVVQMVAVGEATGNMDAMLNKIADFYDQEVEDAVNALTSLLEPMLMVFLGVVVGGMVIALYLPIFNLASAMG